MDESQVFLLSRLSGGPSRFFQGYCFSGTDYIYGDAGAEEYARCTGRQVPPGQDGCYVTLTRRDDRYRVATDFSGNKKLFYYWSPTLWAVSNSLATVIEHLRENGADLSPNFAQLAAMGVGKTSSVFNQLTAYTTIANQVQLVPVGCTLDIGDDGVRLVHQGEPPTGDYAQALGEFCETWISRFETVLSAPCEISSDLTGGMDSRTVFALLHAAEQRLGSTAAQVRISSGSSPGDTTDLEIATEICQAYGYRVNGPRSRKPLALSGRGSYLAWRQLCLGSYHPIYFPRSAPAGTVVAFGGGGGENHRPFYKNASFASLVSRCRSRIRPPWLATQFAAEMSSAAGYLRAATNRDTDALVLHYRHFRNRFHTGRSPQSTVLFSPLGSGLLERASDSADRTRILSGQVNYDIMAAVDPALLHFRFDDDRKSFTADRARALPSVAIGDAPSPGRVYGSPPATGSVPAEDNRIPLEHLYEEFRAARRCQLASDFWGAEFLDETEDTLAAAVETGRFRHAIDGQPVAAVVATALLDPDHVAVTSGARLHQLVGS